MILKFIKFDLENNTIEANWFEQTETEMKSVRCQNYSQDQAEEFAAEVENAAQYMQAMGW
jgi:hypothetical protein